MKNKVLLKDIADKTGYTINTVSRALNNKADISEETKDYIRKTAIKMGYIPNAVASSLRKRKTNTIGILFDNIANYYYMTMTELIHDELEIHDHDVMIFTSSHAKSKFDSDVLFKMVSRQIDGIISFLRPTDAVAEYAMKNEFPILVLGREADDFNIDSVYTNDYEGGRLVGKYLKNKGHKYLSYIGAPADIKCSVKRQEGFYDVLYEDNNEDIKVETRFLEHHTDIVKDAVVDVVNKGVTAIFCFNDSMAYETISVIENMGKRVPEDIAVVGYDYIEERSRIPINLTTITTDKKAITEEAVSSLLKRIKNFDKNLVQTVFEPTLVIGKTG